MKGAMPIWAWVLSGIAGATVVATLLAWWLGRQRNEAGIVTSRIGRTARMVGGSVRMSARHGWRRMRRALSSAEKRAELDRRAHEESAKQALETMGQMKGALMKLGQIVSFMDESLPEAYQEQLKKLQAQAPAMSYDVVARVVREELGKDPEEIFNRFDRAPLAAASIGQVHRARLKDGTDVVVKVQYPGVDDAIRADLGNYAMLMAISGAVMPNVDVGPIVRELQERLTEELDYRIEAKNQADFRRLFEGHPSIFVPHVFPELSSKRVLVGEYVQGRGFYDFLAHASEDERRRAVLALRTFVFDSIYLHGIFNGDPHPGNYLFMPDGKVAFLDFGCVKRFPEKFIADLRFLNRSYLTANKDAYFEKCVEMGFIRDGYQHKVDRDWLWSYARWFYLPILDDGQPFRFTPEYCRQAVSQIFGENMRLLSMPPEYVMMNRITFGLNSILSRMSACEDWRRYSRHYFFAEDELPETMRARTEPDRAAAAPEHVELPSAEPIGAARLES